MLTIGSIERRSGRTIALFRVAIAVLLALSMWWDPSQPVRDARLGAIVLSAYIGYAFVFLAIALANWWLEFRLAITPFLVDAAALLASLYFTEARYADFSSPPVTLFAFIIVAARLRWNARVALAVAVALSLAYLLTAVAMQYAGFDVQLYRAGRRCAHMLMLALIMLAFGPARRAPTLPAFDPEPGAALPAFLRKALNYSMAVTGAKGAALVWGVEDEPRVQICTAGTLGSRCDALGPTEFTLPPDDVPRVFRNYHRQVICQSSDGSFQSQVGLPASGLARYLNVAEGLMLPIAGATGAGQLLLVGIPGLSRDDLLLGESLSDKIARAMNRDALFQADRESAVSRLRTDFARDLHDSVAQSLAGASFLLISLRKIIAKGGDPETAIAALDRSFQAEQAQVRTMIEQLRRGTFKSGQRNLVDELRAIANTLCYQWQADVRTIDHPPVMVPAAVVYNIHQLVREAAANAVRHGAATRVELSVQDEAGETRLVIADNGTGFPADCEARPRSIAERVEALGGTLEIHSGPGETRLMITLPKEHGL